jgi:hypothetical protein
MLKTLSNLVDSGNDTLMMEGYARAFESASIHAAIAINMVQFDDEAACSGTSTGTFTQSSTTGRASVTPRTRTTSFCGWGAFSRPTVI